jgi:ABC-2 type transport system ATP-binding protein
MVEAEGLVKRYGSHVVLDGIGLSVPRGGVLALLGPNGAGKTTTVRILSTLIEADAGQARIGGYDVRSERHQVRRLISLTGQYAAVDEPQTGRENLEMIAKLRGLPGAAARATAVELLERFDLVAAADRRVAGYSGGMRRRLDLAAGLIGDPTVLFLDEPTTGLDPRARYGLWDVVATLAGGGTTILLTTQYLEEADRLADEIALIDAGRIVAQGSPAQLKERLGGPRLQLRAADREAFARLARVALDAAVDADAEQLTLSVPATDDARSIRATLDQLDPGRNAIASFELREPTLDDVFMALTGTPPATAAAAATAGPISAVA